MKIRIITLFILHFTLYISIGAVPVPKEYSAGREWLTPELYNEIDQAVRSGKKTEAIEKMKEARVRQRADRSAFRKPSETRQPDAQNPRSRTVTVKRKPSANVGAAADVEREDPALVIPDPGIFCMSHAFRLRVTGDGGGMLAYIAAATEALTAIADSSDEKITTAQRTEALIRMGNMQEQLLRNYAAADVYYKRALALDPKHQMLRRFAAAAPKDASEPIKPEGEQ